MIISLFDKWELLNNSVVFLFLVHSLFFLLRNFLIYNLSSTDSKMLQAVWAAQAKFFFESKIPDNSNSFYTLFGKHPLYSKNCLLFFNGQTFNVVYYTQIFCGSVQSIYVFNFLKNFICETESEKKREKRITFIINIYSCGVVRGLVASRIISDKSETMNSKTRTNPIPWGNTSNNLDTIRQIRWFEINPYNKIYSLHIKLKYDWSLKCFWS